MIIRIEEIFVLEGVKYLCQLNVFFGIQGYKLLDEGFFEYQIIFLNKIEDFGVYCKQ